MYYCYAYLLFFDEAALISESHCRSSLMSHDFLLEITPSLRTWTFPFDQVGPLIWTKLITLDDNEPAPYPQFTFPCPVFLAMFFQWMIQT